MNGETSLSLTNISDNTIQVQLHQGTLNLRVRKLYRGEIFEVDTRTSRLLSRSRVSIASTSVRAVTSPW